MYGLIRVGNAIAQEFESQYKEAIKIDFTCCIAIQNLTSVSTTYNYYKFNL
jgi:hypothetical protein